ncbi:hypothetical protein PRIPAC_77410 [Pristionchus pacificus]|uniref:Uncharacterized protein n=1 Tax=Pristionchus pacificus TaxID=54126 RepID=A0A454XM74_PRIPA|nr:hypothetical protein PRIPAC_77410 [Pristionchus pacificus]|eukprot:PDM70350.1 hypothetical protein PRIPAC_46596 [Pristionchus pacificus]
MNSRLRKWISRKDQLDSQTISLSNKSSLEELPREIVWKNIEYAPGTIFHLRMTSRTLRSHVDAFIHQPDTNTTLELIALIYANSGMP